MANRILTVTFRVLLLVAVVVSAVLLVDYQSPSGSLCGDGSGCAEVKGSAFSHIGPVSLPAIGLGVFLGIFLFSLWAAKKRHFDVLALQTGVAAAGAVVLIALQLFVLRAVCKWCMAADIAAIGAAALAYVLRRRDGGDESIPVRALWVVAGLAAAIVPLLWSYRAEVKDVALPKAILRLHQPDKVNVVVFTDFECPHCERLHDALRDEEKALGDRVHVVRLMYPLPFHTGAKPAALAYLCTPDKSREAFADKLYKASTEELKPPALFALAEDAGIDREWIESCVASPATEEKLERDMSLYGAAGLGGGVPATFVADKLVLGADVEGLRSAVDRALGGSGGGDDVLWMFVLLGIITAGAAAASLVSALREDEPVEAAT
jgi:uncharacterized membrane protein/predicted DsbA family dithiol-disulfide isomerase